MTTPTQEFASATAFACGWTTSTSCTALIEADVDIAQQAVNVAAEVLYGLSGRQFGLCELKVRPCRLSCCDPCDFRGYRWTPVLSGGQWTNVSCGSCRGDCGCKIVCEVALPGPVHSVSEVKQDGEVLEEGTYHVDNFRTLVRNGAECWPTCQDMDKEDTEVGTWSVTYLRGRPVPDGGRMSLGLLACEIVKALVGDKTCKLPDRVTQITRQGVSVAVLDPLNFLNEGRTGIYMIDLWLNEVNPQKRARSAAVLSPDSLPPRRMTWP